MAVTIKDVAELAGVSPSTVSRTCKDHPSISRQTKEKVRLAMKKLGYEPNFQASSLASQTSRIIGIILPPSEKEIYENSFYLEAIRGIIQYCNEHQYINTVITGKNEEEILDVIRSAVKRGQADGFILLYSWEEDPVMEEGLLYVLVGKAYRNANQTVYVDNDNILAGREAAEYLINLGHRKIGCILPANGLLFAADRRAGYFLALTEHQIPICQDYCVEAALCSRDQGEPLRALLGREDRPTAVVVCDDILSLALETVCAGLGISIPEDLSVISFNNSVFARLSSPHLTSVDINAFQLGIAAASQMLRHIENPGLLATKVIVPHHIIERDSCQPPPGGTVATAPASPARCTEAAPPRRLPAGPQRSH